MVFNVTADTRNGQETYVADSVTSAMVSILEFQDRGAKPEDIYINDGNRKYTIAEINALANATTL
jgi:hypothetical protein